MFTIGWEFKNNEWRITFEASRVLSRTIRPLSPGETILARPYLQLDASDDKVLSMSNLYPDHECWGAATRGRVVKRNFGADGLTLTGVVLEGLDGVREFINVDIKVDNLEYSSRGWIVQGLNRLLAEGREAQAFIKLCGAAGRVEMLDALR